MKVIEKIINFYEVCLTFTDNKYATFFINMAKNDTRFFISAILLEKTDPHFGIIHKLYIYKLNKLYKNRKLSQK